MPLLTYESQVTKRLMEHVKSEDPKLREAAYLAMGNLESSEEGILNQLRNGLTDQNNRVRISAMLSLMKLKYSVA